MQERRPPGSSIARPGAGAAAYSPTRRTALVLVGEGTSLGYLAGALKALDEAGLRIDLILGRGVGAVVAVFGAIHAGAKLYGPSGLLASFARIRPWRLRAPFRVALVCLGAAFAVFVSPALVGLVLLFALPLLAAARIVAPSAVAEMYSAAQSLVADLAPRAEPLYLRGLAFPLAGLFAILTVGWILPAWLGRRPRARGLRGLLGEGLFDLSPFLSELEQSLWEAVRGASTESRTEGKEIGLRFRDLLSASFGQQGFRELVFYALDLDSGQEVPFVLLKERWLSRVKSREGGRGSVAAEPLDLASEAAPLLLGALAAAVRPPGLVPAPPLRLPWAGRYGGEMYRFASSIVAGQSAVQDAVAAGAEQILYISAAAATERTESSSLGRLADAAVRQALESDLRWAESCAAPPVLFVVRPDQRRLGTFELPGRMARREERIEPAALIAHGERDTSRMFLQPVVAEGAPLPREETRPRPETRAEEDSWGAGPREL